MGNPEKLNDEMMNDSNQRDKIDGNYTLLT